MTGKNLFAALMSFVVPGLGQVLNGRLERAALFFGGWLVCAPVGLRLLLVLPRPFNVFSGMTFIAVVLLSALDAAIDDPTNGKPTTPVRNVVVLGIAMFLTSRAWILVGREFNVQLYKFPTGSMLPTISIGDHLAVDRAAYGLRNPLTEKSFWRWRDVQRGDIVVFPYPEDRSRDFLKRVVGLPGEMLQIEDGVVLVDGKALDEPYAHFLEPPSRVDGLGNDWGPEVVPKGHLFVLGDNRQNSRDSRHWGFVPVGDVLGQAKVVYWSADYERDANTWQIGVWPHGIRWERCGLHLH